MERTIIPLNSKMSDFTSSIAIKYGVFMAIGLIVYFWIAWWLGVIHQPLFRLLNLPIQILGIYLACARFRKQGDGSLNYFRALIIGMASSTVGVTLFSVFVFATLSLSPALAQRIASAITIHPYLTPFTMSVAVFVEGLAAGTIGTFILINVLKTDKVNS